MKKWSMGILLTLFLTACSEQPKEEKKDTEVKAPSVMDNPDYDKGLSLVAKSDCFTCHKLREQSVGPAYGAVAAKYESTEANISMLADKILKGGQGVWGAVPMAAHPNVSKEDAIQMVKYILLLKEEKK